MRDPYLQLLPLLDIFVLVNISANFRKFDRWTKDTWPSALVSRAQWFIAHLVCVETEIPDARTICVSNSLVGLVVRLIRFAE